MAAPGARLWSPTQLSALLVKSTSALGPPFPDVRPLLARVGGLMLTAPTPEGPRRRGWQLSEDEDTDPSSWLGHTLQAAAL